jgi:ribosomal protein S18 acetylase RimI-like enzyme
LAIALREEVRPSDAAAVRDVVASTKFFYDHEIDVAVELVDERLAKGLTSGYFFVFAEFEGRVAGYSCYGPIACTTHSYDLYWIAVHSDFQGRGLGRLLLAESEKRIAAAGGRRIYVETSGREQYQPTRSFYEHCGYRREAVLKEFYGPGDDKIVYLKVT